MHSRALATTSSPHPPPAEHRAPRTAGAPGSQTHGDVGRCRQMSVDVGRSRRRRRMRRRRRRLHRRHLGGVALLEDGVRVREDPGLRRALGGAEQPAHLEALVQRHLPVVREVALRQAPPQRGHVVRLRPPAGAQLKAEALGAGPHRAVRVHEDRERRGSIGAFGGWERARTGRHGAAGRRLGVCSGGQFGRASGSKVRYITCMGNLKRAVSARLQSSSPHWL